MSDLKHTLDRVVENGSVQMDAIGRQQFLRQHYSTALIMTIAIPLLAVLTQLVRWRLGFPAGLGFSWGWAIVATLVVAAGWLLFQTMNAKIEYARRNVLGKMDAQLGASERLVTADEFIGRERPDGFTLAAIEDAESWAEKARARAIHAEQVSAQNDRRSWLALPIAVALLGVAAWLSTLSIPAIEVAENASDAESESMPSSVEPSKRSAVSPPPPEPPEPEAKSEPIADRRAPRRSNRQGTMAVVTPDSVEKSQGQLTDGETSESQQSSNPSSAQGEPSSSGQPSKTDTPSPPKPKKERKPKKEKPREAKERKNPEEPSGSTAGQGSSSGSNNNAASSDWSSKSPSAPPEDEEIEDEDDVDDEDEEQESRGGVQPNMRDRRAPVNRDLQIGFGSNRPNPDANGRGGPGGQKKSRGVASLVLGVPIPDRITGQPNKGRIRITQQRITPEAEQSDPQIAESRGARDAATGQIHHPQFTPWLHNVVRQYFLDRRLATPLNSTNPSIDDQTRTEEKESPQS